MNIEERDYCPDNTYFRTGDVEPTVDGGTDTLTIYSGRGTHRNSWGSPGVSSHIILNNDELASVFVGFHHKHGGGQFWRHYRGGERVEWRKLDEAERLQILDGAVANAPDWAKSPGKLKRDYIKPHFHNKIERDEQGTIIGYKYLLILEDGRLCSPLKRNSIWNDNCLTADISPTEDNSSGIYTAKTPDSPALQKYAPGHILARLLLSGIVIEHNYGLRAEHADILEIMK